MKPILFILSGLPASGKSTLAKFITKEFNAVYLRIDTIEQALRDLCNCEVQGEGYRLAYRIASDNLNLGRNVVADSCNPIHLTRREWEEIAIRNNSRYINIEVICSDKTEHKKRCETRKSEVVGLQLPTWDEIQRREYNAWETDRILIDTANKSDKESFYELKKEIESRLIVLKPLLDEDIALFEKWLDKEYIYKWLCPDGEIQRKAWLDEVNNKDGKYNFLKHFIIYHNDRKIGYCLYADCFFLRDLEEEGHDFEDLYGDVSEENHTYEIGYLIGEEEYLNRGVSKIIIQKLEEKIVELGGHEISADPSDENIFSVKALLSNGFKKKKDGDYRKCIV